MSSVLITADLHFGLNKKLNDILWAVKTIREYARNNSIDTVIVCGDIFHDRVHYNIEVYNAVYSFLKETKYEYNQNWIMFPGNHDMPIRNSWTVNAIKPLKDVATVINDIKLLTIYDTNFWVVPFIHYESIYMQVLSKIESRCGDDDILLTHIGVNNSILNACFLIKNWSIVDFTNSKFKYVFAGHFHCHQKVGNVYYPGSPIPYRFDEGMVEHGFIKFDVNTNNVEFINIYNLDYFDNKPPGYLIINDDDIDDNLDIIHNNNIKIVLNRNYSNNELLNFRSKLLNHDAVSVKFQKQSHDNDILINTNNSNIGNYKDKSIFDRWVEHDKPKNLDIDILKKLNKEIMDAADG